MQIGNLKKAVTEGVAFIASKQESDGSFLSAIFAAKGELQTPLELHKIVFTPALMLGALGGIDTRQARAIRTGIATYLLGQKNEQWSFNYWDRNGEDYKKTPYPDDLDDTFCALAGLQVHDDKSLIDEIALARIVKLLLATESQVGGPYKTWLVAPSASQQWQDVDVAVNANIAYFLSLIGSPLPNLTQLLEETIRSKSYASPYYPYEELVVYYVARAYDGELRKELIAWLRTRLQKVVGKSPLRTALIVSSLVRQRGKVPDAAVHYLITSQDEDGSWPCEPVWLDRHHGEQKYYCGSSALSTAFAIEALERYGEQADKKSQMAVHKSTADTRVEATFEKAAQAVGRLDNDLKQAVIELLRRTKAGKNAVEITLLPHLFYESLSTRPAISEQQLMKLGLANLYGWMAYTVYDDFLDDEGVPRLLSAANVLMRRSVEAFSSALPDDSDYQAFVRKVFDTIDAANTWEVMQSRFVVDDNRIQIAKLPHYGRLDKLAQRSLGHALPPLGVLAAAGTPPGHPSTQALFSALKHYIIARQINDDLHDWQEDIRAGRITYVCMSVLGELGITPGTYELDELVEKIEQQFWHHSLPRLCKRMKYHTRQSRVAIRRSGLLRENNILSQLIDGIDESIAETLATHARTERFLGAYKN